MTTELNPNLGIDRTPKARPSSPRIPLIDELNDELSDILANALSHDGSTLNIFRMLGHHPKLLKRFNLFGGMLLNRGTVGAREREIVILRIGYNAQAVYEFGQHQVIGAEAGLTDAEIASLAGGDYDWSDDDLLLIALADELHANDCVSDETFAALAQNWNRDQLVELVMIGGFYRLVSGFLNTFGVPLDDGIPSWPAGSDLA